MKKSQKKILTQSLILLIILLVIGVWYGLKLLPEVQHKKTAGKIFLLKNAHSSDLASISLTVRQNKYTETTVLSNTPKGWKMIEPVQDDLDLDMLNRLLGSLTNLQTERMFTNISAKQLNGYGFDKPSDTFVFHLKNGKTKTLINGDLARTENYYYTLKDNQSNTVYLIYAYKFSGLERMSGELRDRTLWTLPFEEVNKLQITLPNRAILKAEKKDSKWFLTSPIQTPVNDFAFKKQMLNFFTLRILNFPPTLKKNDRNFLEKKSLAKLFFASKNATNTLIISRIQLSNQVLAFSKERSGIFALSYSDITNVFHFKIADLISNQGNGAKTNAK